VTRSGRRRLSATAAARAVRTPRVARESCLARSHEAWQATSPGEHRARGRLPTRICPAVSASLIDTPRESVVNKELFEQGLETRREVLGAEYVEESIRNADEFNLPLQELVTQYCWGEIWNRPGLDRRTRSLLNLAMITALNRPHELKLHVAGAVRNGVTKDEIREVFLQAAIYCGVPAAIDSFRVAREVFKEAGI
jgi:4-carboxymuconolactone decarboxylase